MECSSLQFVDECVYTAPCPKKDTVSLDNFKKFLKVILQFLAQIIPKVGYVLLNTRKQVFFSKFTS